MRLALALLVVVLGCKKAEEKAKVAAPVGRAPVASCDYVAEVGGTSNHSCFEAYDEGHVDALAAWCAQIKGPRDHPTFAKGKGCGAEGRKGGCLFPNGTIRWLYAGDSGCLGGLEFKDKPSIEVATPYRCANPRLCVETMSVFDLTKTVEKKNCETAGGTFELGSCSADNVAGRCATRTWSEDKTWVYYAPMPTEQAKQHCETMPGTFSSP